MHLVYKLFDVGEYTLYLIVLHNEFKLLNYFIANNLFRKCHAYLILLNCNMYTI